MFCRFHHLLTLFLLLAGASALHAQHDVHLSSELLSKILPDDARIQSAAHIGDLTLAVWGSTMLATDNSVRNVLVMQLLRDTTPVAPQRILTDTAARPFGYVQVLALHNRFMVVWNDGRRADTAVYVQRVDTAGDPIGDEELLTRPAISPFGIIQLPAEQGYSWFWNNHPVPDSLIDTTPAICSIVLDSIGRFKTTVQGPVAGRIQQVIEPDNLPGIALLHRGNLPPLFADPAGQVSVLSGEAYRHFTVPYYLEADGSIVTLEGRTIRFFHTFLDSVAYKTLTTPILSGLDQGSQIISRDLSGNVAVLWASGGSAQLRLGSQTTASAGIYLTILTPADTFTVPKPVIDIMTGSIIGDHMSKDIRFHRVSLERGCGNYYRVGLTFVFDTYIDWQGHSESHDSGTFYYNIDTYSHAYGANKYYYVEPPLPHDCSSVANSDVTRTYVQDSSAVRVITASGPTVLAAPVAIGTFNVPQTTPGIVLRDGQLLVGWRTSVEDTLFELGTWGEDINRPVQALPKMNISQFPLTNSTPQDLRTSTEFVFRNDFFGISSVQSWSEPAADSSRIIRRFQYSFHIPTQQGWKRAKTLDLDNRDSSYFKAMSYSRDPGSGDIMGVLERYVREDVASIGLFAIDANGDERWRLDSIGITGIRPLDGILLGEKKYLLCNAGIVKQYVDTMPVSGFTLSAVDNLDNVHPWLERLFGPYIIRYLFSRGSTEGIYVDIMDLDGNRIAVRSKIMIMEGVSGYYIVQNPSDSGFALLMGGKGGWVTLLDKRLNILASNIPLSSEGKDIRNPAGVFRNDTLFVVWEDYRKGAPDIYGRALAAKTSLDVGSSQPGDGVSGIESIIPNPTSGITAVVVAGHGKRSVEVIDSYGRTCMQMPVAGNQVTLDTRSIPAGAYRVILRGTGNLDSKAMIVVH